jgi:hypothetical protein
LFFVFWEGLTIQAHGLEITFRVLGLQTCAIMPNCKFIYIISFRYPQYLAKWAVSGYSVCWVFSKPKYDLCWINV